MSPVGPGMEQHTYLTTAWRLHLGGHPARMWYVKQWFDRAQVAFLLWRLHRFRARQNT
ncbi:MAG: hypothetical protein JOZ65_21985 [Chloroflexi bacterium]|nr:hypothetical protein [Chloroflexota bacterium]